MRIVLKGAPGAGKATQAGRLRRYLQAEVLEVTDLLRNKSEQVQSFWQLNIQTTPLLKVSNNWLQNQNQISDSSGNPHPDLIEEWVLLLPMTI